MTTSTIIDLWPILRRRDLSPSVNDGVQILKLSRYGHSNLTLPDRSWIFSHSCHGDIYPCNICPSRYILENGDSYSRFSNDVDQAVRLIFLDILVLVLLSMVIDYFNDCTCICRLGIAAQIKIMGEPSLVFLGL
jgi:hypothetical protein